MGIKNSSHKVDSNSVQNHTMQGLNPVSTKHALSKGWKCHILTSYQMWFCPKLLKNAKITSKMVKIWPFLWNPHLVAPKSTTSGFLALFGVFEQFLANNCSKTSKKRKLWISALPDVNFTKITKTSLFCCYFWSFWAIFGKTTSGSSPKQDKSGPLEKNMSG